MDYYPAFICENGDVIEASSSFCSDKFCQRCGAPIIYQCPSCGIIIRGHQCNASGYYRPPSYCRACGKPYPWTEKTLNTAIALLSEDDAMPYGERQLLIDLVPDMINETPRTQLAAVRMKKAFKSLGSFAAEGLRSLLIDFGCDLMKKLLGL